MLYVDAGNLKQMVLIKTSISFYHPHLLVSKRFYIPFKKTQTWIRRSHRNPCMEPWTLDSLCPLGLILEVKRAERWKITLCRQVLKKGTTWHGERCLVMCSKVRTQVKKRFHQFSRKTSFTSNRVFCLNSRGACKHSLQIFLLYLLAGQNSFKQCSSASDGVSPAVSWDGQW